MTKQTRRDGKEASGPPTSPGEALQPAELELEGLPADTRQAMLQILRGSENPRAREAAGRRLYLELERPGVLEHFLYTLLCDPSTAMRRFAAAMLAHPSLAGNPWVEDWLRYAVEQDSDPDVRRRAGETLNLLAERKGCRPPPSSDEVL